MDDSQEPAAAVDAFGAALLAYQEEGSCSYVVERSDGFLGVEDAEMYFAEPETWPERDRVALDLVSGRVLDVGAGAGRHALVLQNRGDEAVALDVSPGAVEVCRRRGVRATYLGTVPALAEEAPQPFDAVIMMGNNLALLGTPETAASMLDALRTVLHPDGVVVGSCLDPYLTDDPVHLAYHESNRRRGRLAGQMRLRVRYRHLIGAWFDYLFVSVDELRKIAREAGWEVEVLVPPNPEYLAALRPAS